MDLSIMYPWLEIIIWLIVVVFAVIVEIHTVQLVSVWFAVSGFISMVLAAFNVGIGIQIAVFIILSSVLILIFRKYVKKYNNINTDDATSQVLIGEIARVVKEIPISGIGEVKTKYERYTALAPNINECIKIDTLVKIKEIRGNKLIVEPLEEGESYV